MDIRKDIKNIKKKKKKVVDVYHVYMLRQKFESRRPHHGVSLGK